MIVDHFRSWLYISFRTSRTSWIPPSHKKNLSYAGNFVADENGSTEPLRAYKEKTLVIVLPGDLTVFDIGKNRTWKGSYHKSKIKMNFLIEWLSVWCIAFFVDFGHVQIPKNLNIPPSLRMLGVEPQTKLNCEVLDPSQGFEVRWAIGKLKWALEYW